MNQKERLDYLHDMCDTMAEIMAAIEAGDLSLARATPEVCLNEWLRYCYEERNEQSYN